VSISRRWLGVPIRNRRWPTPTSGANQPAQGASNGGLPPHEINPTDPLLGAFDRVLVDEKTARCDGAIAIANSGRSSVGFIA